MYFYLLVGLVMLLLLLNITNRLLFMRFMKSLPLKEQNFEINDLLDAKKFERLLRELKEDQRLRAGKIRSWLIRIILTMGVVILAILIVGVLSFIK